MDVYLEQKSKRKRKQLEFFTGEKIAEILAFAEDLSNKERLGIDNTTKMESGFRPSPVLVNELHKSTHNDEKYVDNGAVQ